MKAVNIFFIAIVFFLVTSCGNVKAPAKLQAGTAIQLDSLPGECPYFTKDNKGNPVLSWARQVNDSTSVFCFATSKDGGQSFERIVTIPSTDNLQPHSENLPKIIFKPSGEIIALWGTSNPNPHNKYSGLVYYSQSFDEGSNWTKPRPLVGDTASYDQRYYDVALLPNGEAAVIWLDNRKTTDKEGSALFIAMTNGKQGFQNEQIISEGCCQCCRTDLFVDSKGGIHVLYRGILQDSIRDMLHSVSTNGGKTFSQPRLISNDNWVLKGCPHTGPAMAENKEGLHFAWFTGGRGKGSFYSQSKDNGNTFSEPDRVSQKGSHPQIIADPEGKLFVAWDESIQVGEKFNKRIGLQTRTAEGIGASQLFITADSISASYPVIASVGEGSCLVSYCINRSDKPYILFQHVDVR